MVGMPGHRTPERERPTPRSASTRTSKFPKTLPTSFRQVFDNLAGVLEAMDTSLEHVVDSTNFFASDISAVYTAFEAVRKEVFEGLPLSRGRPLLAPLCPAIGFDVSTDVASLDGVGSVPNSDDTPLRSGHAAAKRMSSRRVDRMRWAVRDDGAKGFDDASTSAFRPAAPHALRDCLVVGHARRRYAPASENDPRRVSTLGQPRRTGA